MLSKNDLKYFTTGAVLALALTGCATSKTEPEPAPDFPSAEVCSEALLESGRMIRDMSVMLESATDAAVLTQKGDKFGASMKLRSVTEGALAVQGGLPELSDLSKQCIDVLKEQGAFVGEEQ